MFTCPQVIQNSRRYLLLRTDISTENSRQVPLKFIDLHRSYKSVNFKFKHTCAHKNPLLAYSLAGRGGRGKT